MVARETAVLGKHNLRKEFSVRHQAQSVGEEAGQSPACSQVN